MKIGVVSDTHISNASSQDARRLLDKLKEVFTGVDTIFHAGDIVSLCFLEELKKIAPVEAVHGNMDLLDTLRALPEKKLLEVGRLKIGLIHGLGPPAGLRKRIVSKYFVKPDLIIYGHTHEPFDGTEGGIRFINPGSPNDKKFASVNTVGLLFIENCRVEFVLKPLC